MPTFRRVVVPVAVVAAVSLTACSGSSRSKPAAPATATSAPGVAEPTADPTPTGGPSPSPSPSLTTPATSGPSTSPTPVHLDPAAQRIFASSKAATARLTSLRIVDTVVRGGTTQKLDLRFGPHGTSGHITRGGYTFDLIFTGRTFYFRTPVSFTRAQYKTAIPPAVKKAEGKYVASPATSGNAKPYISLATPAALLSGVFYAHPNLRRGPNKKIGAVTCIGLVDPGQGTFYVRADNALPVEIDATTVDGTTLVFGEYDRVRDPQAPPKGQAVDSKGNPV